MKETSLIGMAALIFCINTLVGTNKRRMIHLDFARFANIMIMRSQ